jgi:hypothetical protein
MRHDGWLGLGIRGLLVRDMLGLRVLLKGLRVMKGENKNWLVDHDMTPLLRVSVPHETWTSAGGSAGGVR